MRYGEMRAAGVRSRTSFGRVARVVVAMALATGARGALATDPPHDATNLAQGCRDCHVLHWAPNAHLTGTDCVSCHSSRGFTTWTAGDQANLAAGTGSSHNWSASPVNPAAGAGIPADPGMAARVGGGALSCGVCHDPHSQSNAAFDPTAPATAGQAGRHLMRIGNASNEMCLDCHSAWAQSREDSRTYTGTARSHPVRWQDAARTTDLTLANAGGGGGSDWTYRQTPYDSAVKATIQATPAPTTTVFDVETSFNFATNALQNFVVRFTSGPYKNVPVRISGNATAQVILATALPAAPAAGTTLEIDRVGSQLPYDVTTNVGGVANQIQDASKSWATAGNNSPTAGAGTVTILSTNPASNPDVGKVCTINSNTATALTLAAGCLTATPLLGSTWAYRINWRLGSAGTTSALGTTTTFIDDTRTLFTAGSIVGMQVRFLGGNFVGRITGWDATTFTGTFTPARASAIAAAEKYVIEPAQVGVYTGTASAAGTTTGLTVAGTPWTGANLVNLLVRFAKAGNAANQGVVTRITANTASTLTFVALPGAVAANDTFEIDLDGNTTNNFALGGTPAGYTGGTVVCGSCHGVHYADSNAATYDSGPVAGDSHLLRRAAGDETCSGCHATGMHNSVTLESSKYGTWGTSFTCGTCHQPHGTNNIYLVKPQITRPDLTVATVDFRNTNGAAVNSFASPTGTLGGEVCNVCHSQTVRSRNGVSTDWSTHYSGTRCTSCHTHDGGFAGAESKGATPCHFCHDFGMRVADTARTGTYHHVMEQSLTFDGASATSYPTNAAPLTDAVDDKTCVQCHTDHNLFRPDMNTSLGANGRGNNLRTRIGSAPPAAANKVAVIAAPNDTSTFFGNADYQATGTPLVGGICISCHQAAQTKDRTNQAPGDAKTTTAVVPYADFSGSTAHNYNVTGSITNGNYAFTVACTKCHNSNTATAYQNGTNGRRFALHTSVDRRLRAPLGMTAPADNMEQDFCYRCHHASTDTGTPGGGPVKTAANADYYGTVTTMTAGSQAIYALMQKGSSASPPGSTSTTRTLYFKPTAQENPVAPMPAGHATGDTYSTQTNVWLGRAMSPWGATVAYEAHDATARSIATGNVNWRRATFTSPAVTGTTTIPAGTWTIYVHAREQNAAANARARYMIYVWNASDTMGATIAARATDMRTTATGVGEFPTTAAPGVLMNIPVTGSAVTLNAGDKIVVDLEIQTQSGTGTYSLTYYWGSNAPSRVVLPGDVTFDYANPGQAASGRHDAGAYVAQHSPVETRADIGATKHVECEDCHDPHGAATTKHTAGTNAVSGALRSVSGAIPTYSATGFAAPTAWADGTATKEHEICYRCHSSYNTGLTTTWDSTWTDVAAEFSPANRAAHPVAVSLNNQTGSYAPKALAAAQMKAPWTAVGTQTMYCSDCHGDDAATPAAQGPHGSAAKYILKGPLTLWPANLGPTSTNYNTTFCSNCHTLGTHAPHADHGSRATCMQCHIQIPHGGMMSRLLGDANGTMPARYAYQGNKANLVITSFQKQTTANYVEGNCGATCDTSRHPLTTGDNW